MEVQNKLTRCPSCGNYYDAAAHATCPSCGGAGASASSFGTTTAPNVVSGGVGGVSATGDPFGPTAPPAGGVSAGGGYVEGMGGTVPVNFSSPVSSEAEAFPPTTMAPPDDNRNSTYDSVIDPVCGWLVCIDGPEKGTDFRIHAGYNYIGREIGDIHISNDLQISREKHAMIAYSARSNTFVFGPSDGRNIVYLNNEEVYNATKIKAYDIIEVGTTKLLFVPLCSEHFSWKQGEDKVD
ncbi:MAG: FHA domain-containing protein [Oscillospiraceae bacterium]|nr:FHA domain-containing protein [Oscillospiraceae bacterium]